MIIIKLIDYIAQNMDVPELASHISEVSVISGNVVRVNNFSAITEYSDEKITLSLMQGSISVHGQVLTIDVISDKFLQISGRISDISFGEAID